MTAPAFTVPVTLHSRGVTGQDSDGNDVYGDTATNVDGVFAPGGSVEQVDGRDMVVDQPTVYLPLPAPEAVDRLTVNGDTFEVDGDPQVWPANPFTGWRPPLPVVLRLKRVTG